MTKTAWQPGHLAFRPAMASFWISVVLPHEHSNLIGISSILRSPGASVPTAPHLRQGRPSYADPV
jgi:hypothetical protein